MKPKTALKKLPEFLTNPDPELYFSDNWVCVDLETTNLEKGTALNPDNSLVLSVWYDNLDGKYHYIEGNEYQVKKLIDRCETADFIIAHNAKFELQWLQRAGLDITKVIVFCTMVAEYVRAGNRRWTLDLDSVAPRYGFEAKENVVSKMIKGGICPSEIPRLWLREYCIKDVKLSKGVFLKQRKILKKEGLLNVFYSRCLSTPVLADIEHNGMCLDQNYVTTEYNRLVYEYADLMREMDEFTGGINPNSPKQVAEFLYDELKFPVPKVRGEPKRTTDKDVISKFKGKTKKQKKFLKLKARQSQLNAALTKTIKPLYKCVTETEDNILYAIFNQTRTQTHRLSSTGLPPYNCQFQNFARIYKPMFTARHEGWKVGEVDSGQLEFRTAVLLARDKQGFKDIEENVDAHNLTAAIIFKEEYGEVQEELGLEDLSHGELKRTKLGKYIRQEAKPHTFKPLYGGQSGTPGEQEYYAAFREKYKEITAMQDKWIKKVLNTKKLVTVTGLTFYWPTTRVTRSGYIQNSTNICNYPVQCFATADVMPIAVRFLWQLLKIMKMQSFLTNTVHDSAIGEVHPDEQEDYAELAEQAFNHLVVDYMEKVYDIDFNLPLEAEIEFNDHWSGEVRWDEFDHSLKMEEISKNAA